MQISINRKLNVAYVHLQDKPDTVETKRLSEDLLMDVGRTAPSTGSSCSMPVNSFAARTLPNWR
jgi:hypothetical protein